eukprot:GDKJ01016835.1.p1 GENE.GDKJ01016835.1~~GDKJ01016835.1.p1  ORF type:complete len:820 (+),score=268.87 GDKJ01016835.1:330-2462(+)
MNNDSSNNQSDNNRKNVVNSTFPSASTTTAAKPKQTPAEVSSSSSNNAVSSNNPVENSMSTNFLLSLLTKKKVVATSASNSNSNANSSNETQSTTAAQNKSNIQSKNATLDAKVNNATVKNVNANSTLADLVSSSESAGDEEVVHTPKSTQKNEKNASQKGSTISKLSSKEVEECQSASSGQQQQQPSATPNIKILKRPTIAASALPQTAATATHATSKPAIQSLVSLSSLSTTPRILKAPSDKSTQQTSAGQITVNFDEHLLAKILPPEKQEPAEQNPFKILSSQSVPAPPSLPSPPRPSPSVLTPSSSLTPPLPASSSSAAFRASSVASAADSSAMLLSLLRRNTANKNASAQNTNADTSTRVANRISGSSVNAFSSASVPAPTAPPQQNLRTLLTQKTTSSASSVSAPNNPPVSVLPPSPPANASMSHQILCAPTCPVTPPPLPGTFEGLVVPPLAIDDPFAPPSSSSARGSILFRPSMVNNPNNTNMLDETANFPYTSITPPQAGLFPADFASVSSTAGHAVIGQTEMAERADSTQSSHHILLNNSDTLAEDRNMVDYLTRLLPESPNQSRNTPFIEMPTMMPPRVASPPPQEYLYNYAPPPMPMVHWVEPNSYPPPQSVVWNPSQHHPGFFPQQSMPAPYMYNPSMISPHPVSNPQHPYMPLSHEHEHPFRSNLNMFMQANAHASLPSQPPVVKRQGVPPPMQQI